MALLLLQRPPIFRLPPLLLGLLPLVLFEHCAGIAGGRTHFVLCVRKCVQNLAFVLSKVLLVEEAVTEWPKFITPWYVTQEALKHLLAVWCQMLLEANLSLQPICATPAQHLCLLRIKCVHTNAGCCDVLHYAQWCGIAGRRLSRNNGTYVLWNETHLGMLRLSKKWHQHPPWAINPMRATSKARATVFA